MRGAPHNAVVAAHIADQFADGFRYRWPSRLAVANFPCPKQPETLAVPSNHGFRLDDDERGSPVAPKLQQACPEESIRSGEFRPLHGTLQNGELMPQSENLDLKGCAAAEAGQEGRKQGREYAGG